MHTLIVLRRPVFTLHHDSFYIIYESNCLGPLIVVRMHVPVTPCSYICMYVGRSIESIHTDSDRDLHMYKILLYILFILLLNCSLNYYNIIGCFGSYTCIVRVKGIHSAW